ncbi:menaquinone-dependent protoporphyrinogen IX dehydrogenase [Parashewanella curva]|uniref:Protoporphyrinogen IX dehydrogenase [quinone] n=1 Tax=Parashewanella curva TaxID=2338552 RepID=A0A3L8Q1T3_9GAMM|nr:menaquinone-dependent protoporphyrinogen IX dehydrogenase [Parashewanella curva]RLV60808.1 menaquinone-dependent protoporphyrinogen IX dehydrogenase [Parashewanella curva]
MQNIALIYSTVDGQTKRICDAMVGHMSAHAKVTVFSLEQATTAELTQYDKAMIGASIRYGKYRPALFEFIKQHQKWLTETQSGFFSVNVVARKPEKNTPETNPYMRNFLKLSTWVPAVQGVFAGKIEYPKYGMFDRTMIRFIMWITKGPTDTSGTYEFTDWDQVEHFAKKFIS